jgi:hypothetical protein
MKKLLVVLALVTMSARAQETVRCESADGRYHECRVDRGRVDMVRQLSKSECVEGESWGWRNGMVWVDKGCRAEFSVTARGERRSQDQIVVCESTDGKRVVCSANTRNGVELGRQISDADCVEGRTWGTTRYGIWVDKGCRAEFIIEGRSRRSRDRFDDREERLILCESRDGRRTVCPADTRGGVDLVRRMSNARCDRGRDWGFDRHGIWVDNGCRAEFAVPRNDTWAGRMRSSRGETIVCESRDGRRSTCAADTSNGVTLQRQISESACVRGRTWGYDRYGIWVDEGCRAEFVLDSRRP